MANENEEYYDIWSGANLIDTVFMLLTIGIMFAFFILRMIYPLTNVEMIIWAFVIESYILGFIILRSRLREKHRKAVRGVKFCYAGWWRDFAHYEKKLLGVTQWYQIDIDWTDEMLKELFEDNLFKNLKDEIENWQKLENFHRPMSLPSKLYSEEDDEDIAKKLIEKMPFKNFKLDEIENIVKEALKKYKIYIGVLYEPESFDDSDIVFDRLCLVTDTDIEQSLKTRSSSAIHEGYPVDIDQVECAFDQLGWILPEIPVVLLAWSENITKKILEPTLEAQSITYIELKVLEKFIYTLRAFSQQAAMALKQEETKSNMYYDAWDDMIQEIENMNINAILGSKDINQIKMEKENKKNAKYKTLSFVLLAVITVIVFIVILFMVMSGISTPTVVEVPESSGLLINLINNSKI
jgi:Ca2+/Na+ antiporter